MSIPFYKTLLSYILPLRIEKSSTDGVSYELQLYQNQWMMLAPQAMYSYGQRYRPFTFCLKQIKNEIPRLQNFLLLGAGLGSALQILQKRYHHFPETLMVDHLPIAIMWSQQYMQLNSRGNVKWKHADAIHFLQNATQPFDLLGVDLFSDLDMPDTVSNPDFIEQCHQILTPNGIALFNTIFQQLGMESAFETNLQNHFSQVQKWKDGINTYFVCRKN